MKDESKEKQALVEEIRRRISHLLTDDKLPDAEKIRIARGVLNSIENGEKEKGGQ